MLHKSKSKAQELRSPKAVNQALWSGAPVQTIKKSEPDKLRQIQKARLGKKMSQPDLAKQINQLPQVVPEYENGKAVPNQTVLTKM